MSDLTDARGRTLQRRLPSARTGAWSAGAIHRYCDQGQRVDESTLDRVKDLPVMPEVAAKVMQLKEGGREVSFRELEGMIKVDPGLTAKILKIANSALYARQREVTNLQTAITLLGFQNIRSLIMLLTASRMFPRMASSSFQPAFWRHSIVSAFLSRSLAQRCAKGSPAEEAFIAGLLHDIGQAVLFNADPEQYGQALEAEKLGAIELEGIEEQMFGVTHRQIGGALLRRWNFPALYSDAAEEHETLNITSPHKTLIILVSVACLLSEVIAAGSLTALRAGLLSRLLPYTCVDGADPAELARACAAELARDPLYVEYAGLFAD
jgi:putative nucleotidyltransferase with HDIG domain